MAKANDNQGQAGAQGGSKVGITPIFLALAFVIALLTSLPTIILTLIAMLPTMVAFVIDRTEGKQNTMAVGAMNFAGLWPYLWSLWTGDHSIAAAMRMLGDPFVWLVIYGAAAFGWTIFILVPPIMIQVLKVLAEQRVETLRDNQKKIIQEWGKEVAEIEPKPGKRVGGKQTVETIDDNIEDVAEAPAPPQADKPTVPAPPA